MVNTLEMSALVSYLSATRRELLDKLTPQEWEDVIELVTQDYTHNGELDRLKDVWVEEGYEEAKREQYDDLRIGIERAISDLERLL
jgi:hypothetical protein